jgi:predicted nucleic acid-binding protein
VIVVADTSPLHYLILIEHVHVLPALFGEVIVPPAVLTELTNERTPQEVRKWLANRPEWLRVQAPRESLPQLQGEIDEGEREAIVPGAWNSSVVPTSDDGTRPAQRSGHLIREE